jgi:uncharacterized protein (DUF305 family)
MFETPVDRSAEQQHDPQGAPEDDVVVLPWWQHPLNILTLLVATALVAAMVGWLVGDAISETSANEVDVGFLQDMREHHEQAVAMSFIFLELDETDPRLRTVSRSIAFGQSIDIGRMIQLLRDFGADEANMGDTSMTWMGMSSAAGSMPGMASAAQLDALAAASGAAADEIFVDLMIGHHLGGLEMAEFAVSAAASDEVRAMAAGIVASQQGEIMELRGLRN